MRHFLKSLVAVFALIVPTGPMAGAVDFYATNGLSTSIYGVNIDGTVAQIGPVATTNGLLDIASNPVDQSTYLLEVSASSPNSNLLYSANIGPSSVSSSFIGTVSTANLIEGGLAFSSFRGTNTLYASGMLNPGGQTPYPVLESIDTATGQGTIISQNFFSNASTETNDIQSLFDAPDGRLWGLNTSTNYSVTPNTYRTDLFRFATDGTVDQTVTISGFGGTGVGGVAVKNGVTYYLISTQALLNSSFGTFGWDSVNSTYTGTFNLISNTIPAGMTGLTLAPATVPEPSTYALAAIASGVMAVLARRRKSKLVKSVSV